MRKWSLLTAFLLTVVYSNIAAQDTTIIWENKNITLPNVMVSNKGFYAELLEKIKNDTSFYRAFKNLRQLGYTARNSIVMKDRRGRIKSTYNSVTRQHRKNGCRTMTTENEEVTGDFYNEDSSYNYLTARLYASLFFTAGTICNEVNSVTATTLSTGDKSGLDKHKEQLKMLFFNPGRKIPGIPFIGDKLDLYDERAREYYRYSLDYATLENRQTYVFRIMPLVEGSHDSRRVVDEMTTWFDVETMQVLARNYRLSYHAGVYDFDVQMEVIMTRIGSLVVPRILRYKGNWDVILKKRENGEFTATLNDFKGEK